MVETKRCPHALSGRLIPERWPFAVAICGDSVCIVRSQKSDCSALSSHRPASGELAPPFGSATFLDFDTRNAPKRGDFLPFSPPYNVLCAVTVMAKRFDANVKYKKETHN